MHRYIDHYLEALKDSFGLGKRAPMRQRAKDWQKIPVKPRLRYSLKVAPLALPALAIEVLAKGSVIGLLLALLYLLLVFLPISRVGTQKIIDDYKEK